MNYIGSKLKLLPFLDSSISQFIGKNTGVFADLFAGTGIVGRYFKQQKGFDIIANDMQYYSYVLNKHYIENSNKINSLYTDSYFEALPKNTQGFIYQNYCSGSGSERQYFTDENGIKCDTIRCEIERLLHNNKISYIEYYYLLTGLLESIDKCANTASVYGAFLKHIKKSAQKTFELKLPEIITNKYQNQKHTVYQKPSEILIQNIKGDILYLDPPYNARQYCSNYHILETIAKYDNPEIHGKTGLRDYSRQKSDFCIKPKAPNALETIIKNADFKYIFLSYNNEGIIPFDVIKNIFQKYGNYEIFTKEYRRFKADSKRYNKSDTVTEYLHCLIK